MQSSRAANRTFNPAVSMILARPHSSGPHGDHRMLEDGIYGLRFAASHDGEPEDGSGLAVLRQGTVLGSDPGGAVFTGTYRFDAERRLNKVRLRLDVPPEGTLVTGFSAGPTGATLDIVGAFEGTSAETTASIQIAGAPVGVQLTYLGPLPN
jgi:hypothetical protein